MHLKREQMAYETIAFEGASGSGKSVLIKALAKPLHAALLDELPKMYHPLKEFPKFSTSTPEAIKANDWFIEREVERCREARELCAKQPVIADRWYFSVNSVSHAREVLFGTKDGAVLEKKIREHIAEGKLFTPRTYVMDCPFPTIWTRLEERYCKDYDLMRKLNLIPEFLKLQQEYYKELAEREGFKVLDGIEDPATLARKVLEDIAEDE